MTDYYYKNYIDVGDFVRCTIYLEPTLYRVDKKYQDYIEATQIKSDGYYGGIILKREEIEKVYRGKKNEFR